MKFLSNKLRRDARDINAEPRSDRLESLWKRHAEIRAMQKVSREAADMCAFNEEQAKQNENIVSSALRDIENQIDAFLDIDIEHFVDVRSNV